MELKERMEAIRERLGAVEREVGTVIVGQNEALRHLITAVFAGGHVLLEGLPGLGKTLMVTTLKDVLQLSYARIQFTPDLMPADITGTNIVEGWEGQEKKFRFEPGPIFANLLLADEINRASPKTQSALLQAMQEKEITVFGRHIPIEEPFCTVATQNPIEMEGTYPLPEAQLDRFLFKIVIRSPALEQLKQIARIPYGPERPRAQVVLDRAGLLQAREAIARVPIAEPVLDFAARLVQATHPEFAEAPAETRALIRHGASPRALQGLLAAARVSSVRDGRFHVSREDIEEHVLSTLRHRIILSYQGELQRVLVDDYLRDLLGKIKG